MYKRHSRFFNSSSRVIPGLEAANPAMAKAEKRRANRTERNRTRERKLAEIKLCIECKKPFSGGEMLEHLFRDHKLCKCRYCKKFVIHRGFVSHIKEVHGLKTYRTWLDRKAKSNERKNR